MSDFAFLLEKTRAAYAAVARIEAALSERPNDAALQINLQSQKRLSERFEEQFFEMAQSSHIDVCRYRIVPNTVNDYSISAVAKSLETFQELFTMIYGAIQYRAQRIGRALMSETALQFGYSYAGSLGIVLFAPGSRDLFFAKFGPTVEAAQQLFGISSRDEVIDLAHKLGNPVVKRAYDWSVENMKGDFSIDLNWRQSDGLQKGKFIDRPQIARMAELIGLTSDERIENLAPIGVLVGINLRTRSFHFVIPDGDSFKGSLGPEFPVTGTVEVGRYYRARISTKVVVHYATEDEDRRNTLLRLEKIDPSA